MIRQQDDKFKQLIIESFFANGFTVSETPTAMDVYWQGEFAMKIVDEDKYPNYPALEKMEKWKVRQLYYLANKWLGMLQFEAVMTF